MRRFIAFALALSILSSGLSGCSQPIDPGSSVPAASQPIVALLALVGLGIGLTAWHHHNENRTAGGGNTPPLFGAPFMVAPFISGYKPVSLVVDPVNLTLGAVLVPTGGTGTGKFTEIQQTSSGASPFGTYALPPGYAPTAVAMDSNGITWFVDGAGTVQACDAMTALTTACSSLGVFSDGLGAGSRSIAADVNFVIVVMDGGAGQVKWWVFPTATSSTANSGTYSSTTTSPIFAADAIESTSVSPSSFAVYHQDGTSDVVTFTASGSTVTVNSQPSYLFKPATLVAPSNFEQESLAVAFFSFTGAPGGAYSLSKYEATNPVGLGNPKVTSQLIAFNGQLSQTGAQFHAPLFSIRADVNDGSIWAIDQAGDIVNFLTF